MLIGVIGFSFLVRLFYACKIKFDIHIFPFKGTEIYENADHINQFLGLRTFEGVFLFYQVM